jgi:hypothetical protein
MLQAAAGFRFEEDTPGKPGYIASQPGSTLTVKINTQAPVTALADTNASSTRGGGREPGVFVHLGYLNSYEHMGMFEVSCVKVGSGF